MARHRRNRPEDSETTAVTTLAEYRAAYKELSGTASTIARNLGFAGIAIIWVFKQGDDGDLFVPKDLFWPGLLITVGLTLDFLQYVIGAAMWGAFARIKEMAGFKNDDDFLAPRWMNWPALFFFWTKFLIMICAYFLLGKFIYEKI